MRNEAVENFSIKVVEATTERASAFMKFNQTRTLIKAIKALITPVLQ